MSAPRRLATARRVRRALPHAANTAGMPARPATGVGTLRGMRSPWPSCPLCASKAAAEGNPQASGAGEKHCASALAPHRRTHVVATPRVHTPSVVDDHAAYGSAGKHQPPHFWPAHCTRTCGMLRSRRRRTPRSRSPAAPCGAAQASWAARRSAARVRPIQASLSCCDAPRRHPWQRRGRWRSSQSRRTPAACPPRELRQLRLQPLWSGGEMRRALPRQDNVRGRALTG